MINFRYHVVSLTAVFLALAIGLVVGTAALNGPVADSLKDRVESVGQDNSNLREQVNQLREEVNREEDFAKEAAPALAGGKLAGRRVLVLVMPTGQDFADSVTSMLTIAGAKVTGRITVQEKFVDPEQGVGLLALANQASQPSVSADGLPLNSDGVETSAALLAKALLERSAAVDPGDLTAVLTAYASEGYLAASERIAGGAEATVVVSGLPPVDSEADKRNQAALTLVTQFAKPKPLVVAGSGIGDGSLVAEVRADPSLVKSISTVDNVSTSQGQLVAALAAGERLVQGKTGHYGLAAGAVSLMPKPAV
ncbi:MAG TPA: copper transporter [Actinoplanes sp.]|nr:copper transporter [Actinoplanes sp.]